MIPKIMGYFDQAIAYGASDLHLKPASPPLYRVNGHMVQSEEDALAPQEMYDLFLPLIDVRQQKALHETFNSFSIYRYKRKSRIRYYLFQQREGYAGSFRFISPNVPMLADLGLPQFLENQASAARGLLLITGSSGAGKSNTLAALVQCINKRFARHIITMENPIEFIYTPEKAIFTQIEVGTQIPTYQEAVTNALREDPDVMLIGEMVDQRTVEMALVAAETGHLVLSTLPTVGAAGTIERVVSFFPPDKHDEVRNQLAMNLLGIFSQMLIPRVSYAQRQTVAYELMVMNSSIRTMIRDKKYSQLQSAMLMARREGCITLKDCLTGLLRDDTNDQAKIKSMLQEIVE